MAFKRPPRISQNDPGAIGDAADGGVKSANRVLEVFEFFAERQGPALTSEIVEALGYPQSSTTALLKSLVRLRYLAFDRRTRLFTPTIRVALMGAWIHEEMFSNHNLLKLLNQLHAATRETVILGMQNDVHVQYVNVIHPPALKRSWYIRPGSLRPLTRSAIGCTLLSQKSDVEVLAMLPRINAEESDPSKRVLARDLLAQLDVIRQQGYAETAGSVLPGLGVISVIMKTPASQPMMAIGVGGEISVLKKKRELILQALRQTVRLG